MVSASDRNFHHLAITSFIIPDEWNKVELSTGKRIPLRLLIFLLVKANGKLDKSEICFVIDYYFPIIEKKSITDALYKLTQKTDPNYKLYRSSQGTYQFYKPDHKSSSTVGVVEVRPDDLESLKVREELQEAIRNKDDYTLFKWFSQLVGFHGVKGTFVNVRFWDEKYHQELLGFKGTIHKEKLRYHPGYIRIVNNYGTLQFFFASKDPDDRNGLNRQGLIDCIATLYDAMFELGFHGVPIVKYLEARNSRKLRQKLNLPEPIILPLIAKWTLKAYEDKLTGELQTELIGEGLDYYIADLFNFANGVTGTVHGEAALESIKENSYNVQKQMNTMKRVVLDTADTSVYAIQEIESKAVEMVNSVETKIETANSRLYETNSRLSDILIELETIGGRSSSNSSALIDLLKESITELKTGFNALNDKMEANKDKLDDVHEDLKQHDINQKVWNELNEDQQLEAIEELRSKEYSWREIAKELKTYLSAPYRVYTKKHSKTVEVDETERNNMVVEQFEKEKLDGGRTFTNLKTDFGIIPIGENKDSQDNQVLKVLQKLRSGYSSDFINILSHLKESNVRRSLSRILANHDNVKSRKVNGKKIYYLEESN